VGEGRSADYADRRIICRALALRPDELFEDFTASVVRRLRL
jgi:hypothetical protein